MDLSNAKKLKCSESLMRNNADNDIASLWSACYGDDMHSDFADAGSENNANEMCSTLQSCKNVQVKILQRNISRMGNSAGSE